MAEFGYSWEYIDEYMDLERFEGHMRYRKDCPPAGLMVRLLMEGLSGNKSKGSSYRPEPVSDEIKAIAKAKGLKIVGGDGDDSSGDVSELLSALGANGMQVVKRKKVIRDGE